MMILRWTEKYLRATVATASCDEPRIAEPESLGNQIVMVDGILSVFDQPRQALECSRDVAGHFPGRVLLWFHFPPENKTVTD